MRARRGRGWGLAVSLIVAACGGDDGSSPVDAGPESDAGRPMDGAVPEDGGEGMDAMRPADGGGGDDGSLDPDGALADGTAADAPLPDGALARCDGREHGTVETRDCYATPSAPCVATTQSRTCGDGTWSPDWPDCDYFACGPGSYVLLRSVLGAADRYGGWGVAMSPTDDVFVAAGLSEVLDTDLDFYLFVGDPTGRSIWTDRNGGTSADEALAIDLDGSGNVVAAGYSRSSSIDFGGGALAGSSRDVVVASYTGAGTYRWARRLASASDQTAWSVTADAMGRVTVVGTFAGSIDPGGGALTSAGGDDVFVAGYDTDGVFRWAARYGSTGDDQALAVTADASGNVYATGEFEASVDFGGGALVSAGLTDVFVASYASGGTHRWSRRYGGTSVESGNAIAVDASGSLVVTGEMNDTVDFGGGPLVAVGTDIFLASFTSSTGAHVWSRRYGVSGADRGHGVAIDATGDIFVTGESCYAIDLGGGPIDEASGGTPGCPNMFVASYEADGSYRWARIFGGLLNDTRGRAIAVGGHVSAVGDAESSIYVDGHGSGWGGAVLLGLTR